MVSSISARYIQVSALQTHGWIWGGLLVFLYSENIATKALPSWNFLKCVYAKPAMFWIDPK